MGRGIDARTSYQVFEAGLKEAKKAAKDRKQEEKKKAA